MRINLDGTISKDSYAKSLEDKTDIIAVPPNPADQEGVKSTENTFVKSDNSNPYDRTLTWVEGYIKPNGCQASCEEGGDVVWIRSEHGWEKAYCIKCGIMHHTQFMCQLNCCEYHEHCKDCGAELCMCCFDGNCYVCNLHEDDDIDSDTYGDIIKGKPIFSSQATAQRATFFGSRFIDGW